MPLLVMSACRSRGKGGALEDAAQSAVPLRLVDLEKRVALRTGGNSSILASDGTVLAELVIERCTPLEPSKIPGLVVDAFVAAGGATACEQLEPGPLRPLMVALNGSFEPRADPSGTAALCAGLRDAVFGELNACLPAVPVTGGWLSLDDPGALRAAYLNLADFGGGDFGIEIGAKSFFNKGARELDVAEAALLAAAAAHPEVRNNPVALRRARDEVLGRLLARGLIGRATFSEARQRVIPPRRPRYDPRSDHPTFILGVKSELRRVLGGSPALRGGVKVHTSLDLSLMKTARKAIERDLKVWEKNRKKESKALQALMEQLGTDAASLPTDEAPPGSLLEVPEDAPSVSMIALEPVTGKIRVMLDNVEKQSDIAEMGVFQRRRQAGSSFKPFLYAAALERGMIQADVFTDAPLTYKVKNEEWSPKNHEEKYYKHIVARSALAFSLNSVAIQLMFRVGPERVADLAQRLGIESRLRAVPALALGTSPVSLGEMVAAYAGFESMGRKVTPRYIDFVEDNEGHKVSLPIPDIGPQVLDPRVAYVLVDMLREVTTSGTAWPAKALGFPVAGKTGTTNESKDAWFMGFSTHLVAGVWIGFDEKDRPLGGHETGGSLALPIWMSVMRADGKVVKPGDFQMPPGIDFERRTAWSGQKWEKGKLMAFISPSRPPCIVLPPDGAMPVEGEEWPEDKIAALVRERKRRKLHPDPKCMWTPVTAVQPAGSSTAATPLATGVKPLAVTKRVD